MTWPAETAHFPDPVHHAQVNGVLFLCVWLIPSPFHKKLAATDLAAGREVPHASADMCFDLQAMAGVRIRLN
jgi:hypothetical protein